MPSANLKGKTALVTGAGTRLGAAISRALAEAGCDIAIHYGSNEAGALEVKRDVEGLGRRAAMFQADLTDREQIDRLAKQVDAFYSGRLGVLVHNAGSFERVLPEALSDGPWD